MESISNQMVKGAAWMVGFKILERSIGLVSTIILARLLEPGDFGLVAIATAFLGLLLLLTNFNFDIVLILKKNSDRQLYDTAWTFNVIFGLSLAILLTISANPLANFYKEPRLEFILYVLALSTFLGGFTNIGPVAFRKELQFHKEFYFLLAKKLISFSVCILLAFSLRNYWALIWGTFAGTTLEILLSYYIHPYRPRLCLRGRKELFSLSLWLFVNNGIFFAYHRMADFIISKLAGSHALGVYTIAYELSNLPTTELVAPINRAVLPGYSKMANDSSALHQGFFDVLSIIAFCVVPAGIGIDLVSNALVEVILGKKWLETIPLIKILAISGIFVALQTNLGSLYIAVGKPRLLTVISLCHVFLLFLPLLIYLMKNQGVTGVAKAYFFSNIIIFPINLLIAANLIKLKISSIISVLWRPFLSSAIMAISIANLDKFLIDHQKITCITILLSEVCLGLFIYLTSIFILWRLSNYPDGAEKLLLRRFNISYII